MDPDSDTEEHVVISDVEFKRLHAEIERLRGQNEQVWKALTESVKLQTHYAGILNQYDGGVRIQFFSTEAWLERLRALEQNGDGK